jgi:predicted Zn-dependent protease
MAVAAAQRSKAADGHSINQDISLAYMYSRLDDMPDARSSLIAAADGAKSAHVSATLQFALQTLIDMSTQKNRELFPEITDIFRNVLANPSLLVDDCYAANMWNSFSLFQDGAEEIPSAIGAIHEAVALCPKSAQLRANFARLLLQYGDLRDARPQLDALRKLHDIRTSGELQSLQEAYDSQVRRQGK